MAEFRENLTRPTLLYWMDNVADHPPIDLPYRDFIFLSLSPCVAILITFRVIASGDDGGGGGGRKRKHGEAR